MGYFRKVGMKAKHLAFDLGRKHLGQVVTWAIVFIFGMAFAFTQFPGETVALDELRTQALIYWPGWLFVTLLAAVGVFVKAAKDIDSEKQAELDVVRIGLQQTQNELQEIQAKLAAANDQASRWRQAFENGRAMYGTLRLWICGHECKQKRLSVRVRFILPGDRSLAQSIRKLFVREGEEFSPWKIEDIDPIGPQNNPSAYARIVLFSNDCDADGMVAAIRDHRLIGEQIVRMAARPGQSSDVEVVIFDHVREQD